jgi:imidazoleglycerol-phosphate dehydratase
MMGRSATIDRKTNETQIHLAVDLDGTGQSHIDTPVGFLNHMLDLFARHSLMDLRVRAHGDTHIDDHHTVEDIGIVLGLALAESLGDKRGIQRYGSCTLPMDETLVTAAVDCCGRVAFVWKVAFEVEKIGSFDVQLVREFWNAVACHARMNYHAVLHHGENAHHVAEAVFKASARALRMAATVDARLGDQIPSTKGSI